MNACLECGQVFTGRIDKRFCDDYCRSTHHNKKYRGLNLEMRQVNAILRQNRRILAKLRDEKVTLVSRKQLAEEGFDFRYMTDMMLKDRDTVYRYCYDFGYFSLGTTMCGIICRDDGT